MYAVAGLLGSAGSKDTLGHLNGLRFESLCPYRPALIVGGKLKHSSSHCLVKECLSLTSARFSARPVSLAGRDKDSLVHWQFASPDPLIALQAPGRLEDMRRAAREAGSRDHGPRT